MKALLFAAMAVAGGAAQAQDQFDLSCQGRRIANGEDSGEATAHLRIDLTSQRYCMGECGEQQSIARASADRIDFLDPPIGTDRSAMQANITSYFDRRAGRYHRTIVLRYTLGRRSPRSTMTVVEDMTCETAPFSGFAAAETAAPGPQP